MSGALYQSLLQEHVNHVLGMAQRDTEELFGCATNEVEELDAQNAASALNETWYLLENAPSLYFCLKAILPLAERAPESKSSKETKMIIREARKTLRLAEQRVKRAVDC